PIVWDGPSNPLGKTVTLNSTAWLQNFRATPWLAIVPLLGIVAPLLAAAGFGARRSGLTLLASKFGIACIIATVGLSMFPIILPSSTHPNDSLAVFDASSSHATLRNMLIATVILSADRARLYRLGLQGAVGQGQRNDHPEGRIVGLLSKEKRRQNDVVLCLDPRPRTCCHRRHPQRALVRASQCS